MYVCMFVCMRVKMYVCVCAFQDMQRISRLQHQLQVPSFLDVATLSEETGPSSSWISERRGRGSEPTEWMSIELQESQQPELRPEVGVSEAEVRSLPSSTRDPITAPEKRRKGAWMKLVQRGWRIFDYLAGIRDHHSQNTRWGRRLGLGVCATALRCGIRESRMQIPWRKKILCI